jgi:hypothetical protein
MSRVKLPELVLALAITTGLALSAAMFRGYNSDALYTYSLAKDIFQFGSLKGWTYAASPFVFPDVLLSLPAAIFINSPFWFHVATAPIQLLLFVVGYSFLRSHGQASVSKVSLALACAGVCILYLGLILFKNPFYFLAEPVFIFAHHGCVALAAILLFLYTRENTFQKIRENVLMYGLLFIVLIGSDFFFSLYFGSLLLAETKKKNWKLNLAVTIAFSILSIVIFILSWKLNPSLSVQAGISTDFGSGDASIDKLHTVLRFVGILLIPTAILSWINLRNTVSDNLRALFISIVIVSFVTAITGLVKSADTYRYACMVYPVTAIMLAEVILSLSHRKMLLLASVCFVAVFTALAHAWLHEGRQSMAIYKSEIDCLRQNAIPGSTVIAEYWPAKIIFESTHRQFNLIQVNENADAYAWISNSRWKSIYPKNGFTYLVLANIKPEVAQRWEATGQNRLICNGKILQIETDPKVFGQESPTRLGHLVVNRIPWQHG